MDDRHRLEAHVGSAGGVTKIDETVDKLSQTQVLGQGGRLDQSRISDETLVVEHHIKRVETMR